MFTEISILTKHQFTNSRVIFFNKSQDLALITDALIHLPGIGAWKGRPQGAVQSITKHRAEWRAWKGPTTSRAKLQCQL